MGSDSDPKKHPPVVPKTRMSPLQTLLSKANENKIPKDRRETVTVVAALSSCPCVPLFTKDGDEPNGTTDKRLVVWLISSVIHPIEGEPSSPNTAGCCGNGGSVKTQSHAGLDFCGCGGSIPDNHGFLTKTRSLVLQLLQQPQFGIVPS